MVCADASPAFLQVIDQIKNLILALNLVSIVAAIIISLILARSILSPVRLLVDAARRVSRVVRLEALGDLVFGALLAKDGSGLLQSDGKRTVATPGWPDRWR